MRKEVIRTNKAPRPSGGYSQAIKLGDMIYVSGTCPFEIDTGEVLSPDDIAEQTRIVLKYIENILNEGGSSIRHVVKVTSFITELGHFKTYDEVYRSFFPNDPPARSTVEIVKFPPGMCIEIECVAYVPQT